MLVQQQWQDVIIIIPADIVEYFFFNQLRTLICTLNLPSSLPIVSYVAWVGQVVKI